MRFSKAWCPRPARGRGRARHGYNMSPQARKQRRDNIVKARASGAVKLWRSHDESLVIGQPIRQWAVESEPRLTGRALARKLNVRESHVRKLRDGSIAHAQQRVTWDDLDKARSVTERLRLSNPTLFAFARGPRPRAPAELREPTPKVQADDTLNAAGAHAALERFREEHRRKWPHLYRQ
jgi:hypothetical protein